MTQSTLTDKTKTEIIDLVKAGLSINDACACTVESINTWKGWLKKGKKGIEPYSDFYQKLQQAKAIYNRALLYRIDSAGIEDWRAASYIYERRNPRKAYLPLVEKIELIKMSKSATPEQQRVIFNIVDNGSADKGELLNNVAVDEHGNMHVMQPDGSYIPTGKTIKNIKSSGESDDESFDDDDYD